MTKEKKKLNHDEKLRKKFFKNLRAFCKRCCLNQNEWNDSESQILILENNEKFNPVLNWKFRAVCSCEFSGFRGLYCFRHNRLFDRNAKLLFAKSGAINGICGDVSEGTEIWLLDNMTLAITNFTEYANAVDENVAYRYLIKDKYTTVEPYFDVMQFLCDLNNDIDKATLCFEE